MGPEKANGVCICLLVGDAWKEATFSKTKEASNDKQARKILDNTEHDCAKAPSKHNARDPNGRSESLHGNVGRNLSGDIKREEYGHGNLSLFLAVSKTRYPQNIRCSHTCHSYQARPPIQRA